MLASKRLIDAMNQQVGHEMGASMQYIAIASHFSSQSLNELGRHYFRQAEEEREHAMKFVRFIVDAGGVVKIPAIAAPKAGFKRAAEAIELALRHEEKVTAQINALVEIARGENNNAALRFFDWFVNEQFEEVTNASALLQVVERAGEDQLLLVEEFLAREVRLSGPPEAAGS